MSNEHSGLSDAAPSFGELELLIDESAPEELGSHPQLAAVYGAASAIAISSYNGAISTSPVEYLPAGHEELVQRLLKRFDDGRGYIEFPLLDNGRVDEIVASATGVAGYRLRQRKDAQSDKNITYFTSFPQ